ncbi:MAG: c-type cytochrome, partial [Planctomycetaceae bacterium]|nr:c-type cytochrome [Planctomycetaceae bacterium]
MRRICLLFAACAVALPLPSAWCQSNFPVVAGYQRFRPELSDVEAGRLLLKELNCQSCHGEFEGLQAAARRAPILTNVAQRVTPAFLREFLANPHTMKPGSTMPAMPQLEGEPGRQLIEALTAFLNQGEVLRSAPVSTDAVRRGERLFHTIGCAACHGDQRLAAADRPADSVPLGQPEKKYTVGTLISFLQDPHAVRPSGRMPSLNLTAEEARDVASYLLQDIDVQPNIQFEYYEGSWESLPDFSTLTPKSTGGTTDFSEAAAERKETFALRFSAFLHIPQNGNYRFFISSDDGSRLLIDGEECVNNDGIHPASFRNGSKRLTAGVHEVTVEYFEYHGEEKLAVEFEGPGLPRQPLAGHVTATREPPAVADGELAVTVALADEGGRLFASLGCASCHQHGDGEQRIHSNLVVKSFGEADLKAGCLSDQPSAKSPRFTLSKQQRQDLRAALASLQPSEPNEIRSVMLTLNCYACHERDQFGGVPSEQQRNSLFAGTVPEMGDEGRIPPSLTGAGDKLNENWLRHLIAAGAKDRPYMLTRMPKFGAGNTGRLIEEFVQRDVKPDTEAPAFTEAEHRVKADARMLVGDQGLSCIKCHYFDKHSLPGINAMDMTTMTQRLRRDWFHRYLANPSEYRPGTRMPSAWPNGRSLFPKVLEGRADVQIEAIWSYLEDGKNARIPSGLITEAIELKPVDRPIIYRNFLEGVSPRGIAVGFPEKAHFAWDAEQKTARLIWHGAFIDAGKHWIGRGPGNQTPLGDHILSLPQGPVVAALPSAEAEWPQSESASEKIRFLGYRL